MGRMRLGAIAFAALVVLLGVAVPLRGPVWQAVAAHRSAQPLTEDEAAALGQCKDPGWTGLSRVLRQDLAVDCPEMWLALTVAGHLGERERRWVSARQDSGPVRQRFRYATALFVAGEPAPPDWPFLASDPGVGPGVRDEVVAAAISGHLDATLFDLVLMEDYDRARFLAGDRDGLDSVVRTLRRYAARPERASVEERAKWASAALAAVGLPGDRLEIARARQARGLAWRGVPEGLIPVIANRGDSCADRASPACLVLAADLLEADRRGVIEGGEGGPGAFEAPIAPPPASVRALIELLATDASAFAGAAGTIDASARWVASAPMEQRARRVVGAVAWPVARAPQGVEGDPVDALVTRAGSPWATAVAAMAVGEAAGVGVEVHTAGEGVRVVAGDEEVYVGPCRGVRGLSAGYGPAWPAGAVVAQAALEASGAALRGGRGDEALRLATFAERLDPVGAQGAVAAVASLRAPSNASMLGRQAGARLSPPAATPTGAEEERAQRPAAWADLVAKWQRGRTTECPSILGP